MTIRLAIDIGGTFTALALEDDGTRHTVKVLPNLDRPADGLMLVSIGSLKRPGWRRTA